VNEAASTGIVEKLLSFDYLRAGMALLVFCIGIILIRVTAGIAGKVLRKSGVQKHAQILVRKLVFWGMGFLVLLITLEQIGIELTAIIATVGFVTIALGFAAQTAFSNIISGLFLLVDRPFVEDESVTIGNISGIVISVDLLSTKIRTWDNIFVRIPNSSLLTETIKNLSRHPIRRVDIPIIISFKDSTKRAKELILHTAQSYHAVLEDPDPTVYVIAFEDSGVQLELRAWVPTNLYLGSRSDLLESIKQALQDQGFDLVIPHRMVYVRQSMDKAEAGH